MIDGSVLEQGNEVCYNTRKSRLYNKTRKGVLSHVRKGVYVPSYLTDKFRIACNAVENGCLVYHSALEYYTLHTQSFNWVYIHSTTPFRTFIHLNETYIYKPVNCLINPNLDFANENYPIRVTSLSQTIIDCIRHIDLAGGLEELMNALDWLGIVWNMRMKWYHIMNVLTYGFFVALRNSSTSRALASSSVSARQVSIFMMAASLVISPPVRARIIAFVLSRSWL